MDPLEISGRRFLSTRRAAKDHKYTADYVGQLIRGGKVVGKKVGRSWYVDEQSLNAYLSGALPEPVDPPVLKVKEVTEAPAPLAEVKPAVATVAEKVTEPVQVMVEEEKIEPHVVEKVVEEKTFEPIIVKSPMLEEHHIPIRMQSPSAEKPSGGLRYVADDEPALPEMKRKVVLTTAPPAIRMHQVSPVEHVEEEIEEEYIEVAPRRRLGAFAVVGVVIAAAATFSATAALSATLNSRIVVEEGQVAGVGYTFE